MAWITRNGCPRVLSVIAWLNFALAVAMPTEAACEREACKMLAVGDMVIGDDAFNAGLDAVQQAMVQEAPDVVLYLGDYIYTSETCESGKPSYAEQCAKR